VQFLKCRSERKKLGNEAGDGKASEDERVRNRGKASPFRKKDGLDQIKTFRKRKNKCSWRMRKVLVLILQKAGIRTGGEEPIRGGGGQKKGEHAQYLGEERERNQTTEQQDNEPPAIIAATKEEDKLRDDLIEDSAREEFKSKREL